ncbi:MAG: pyruvate, water dikinase [Desulfobacteraceae bacterium]|nr:MAG: pyruvate, water dikinase [Desulfobacteraceae bacterium]
MTSFSEIINYLLKRRSPEASYDPENLRTDFKARYHSFKLLLNSNNKALDIMADIEKLLDGTRLFGMSHVKADSTAVSVNVYKMIKNLEVLAPGKYSELSLRFNDIQQQIDKILSFKKPETAGPLVIPIDSVNKEMSDIIGSKMANIGEMKNRLNLNVPAGFIITSAAYRIFFSRNDLQTEIDRLFQTADTGDIEQLYTLSAKIRQTIIRASVPEELENAISESYAKLERDSGKKIRFALRSSAIGEDTAGSSFAGLYHSELNVSSDNILEAYKNVVAGKYSLPAITYRFERGFRDEDVHMSVGCMEMVDAVAGGVMYSKSPVDLSNDFIFINSAWGLPKSVVDGSVDCDVFVVSRDAPMSIVHKEINIKNKIFLCFPQEGVCRMEVTGALQDQPSLSPEQANALAGLAVKIEKHYGIPQDIEWAITDDGICYMLQCRPLQIVDTGRKSIPADIMKNDTTALARGGVTASPGAACGKIFHVDRAIDILRFPEGSVLVARQALPMWAPLISRASAVITEQGGFAGHLANVAREFGVPALFGLPKIYDALKEDDLVTVDASGLAVHKGKMESIAFDLKKTGNLMKDSPVYGILKEISGHIVTLNLLDPDSREFKPSGCKTFHDITRFIHEKSVQEMFNFGKEHNFSERSGKQLVYNIPMQWWVLNLDDGFKEEVEGRYVNLDNIVSIPMLAIWDGITAIPWDGPPPVDGRGFMNVMFEATRNPELSTGLRSRYAERNYFIISKYFCSLNSRLGFHFSIIESIVCDRTGENYISFQYKGGAADHNRRLKRVLFLAEILEEYGFKVTVKKDSLFSRIDNRESDFMKKRLNALGYLTIHTRQIDMIMSRESTVNYYKSKFKKDIDLIIGADGGKL